MNKFSRTIGKYLPLVLSTISMNCGPNQSKTEPPYTPIIETTRSSVLDKETEQKVIPTSITLLRVGTTFLAYVTVPQERDVQDAKVTFYSRNLENTWLEIPGCIKVSSCDVSDLIHSNPVNLTIRVNFAGEGYTPSTSELIHVHP